MKFSDMNFKSGRSPEWFKNAEVQIGDEVSVYAGNRLVGIELTRVDVTRVDFYNDRVTKVSFSDGTFTKSVCGEGDIFDKDTGITICLLKKMLGKNGHKRYNKLMRDIHKMLDRQEAEAQQKRMEEAKRKTKAHMDEVKRQRKQAEMIKIQSDIIAAGITKALMSAESDGEHMECEQDN